MAETKLDAIKDLMEYGKVKQDEKPKGIPKSATPKK